VRARITVGDKLMFTTTQAYPVITNGAPSEVALMLQPAGGKTTSPNSPAHGGTAAPGKASPAKLQATYWKLTELDGHPSVPATGRNEAHLMLHQSDANFAASSGCNRISGTYELEANSLRLSPGPMTMMACADALMQQEQAFVAALKTVTSYRIDGKTLDLLAGNKVLARFMAEEDTKEPK
jgi:putative lipoprotein